MAEQDISAFAENYTNGENNLVMSTKRLISDQILYPD